MRQVCELLDVTDDTVRRLVKRGLLAPSQTYRGIGVRWSADDVDDYLARERLRQRGIPVDEPTPLPQKAPRTPKTPPGGEGCQEKK